MGLGRWTTGSAVGTGGQNGLRLAWRIDQSPSSVGTGTSSVTLRLRIRAETRRSVYDSSNSFNVSGDWPNRSGQSRNISHSSSTSWSSQNRTIIYDEKITVSTSYTGTRTRSFSASFSGIEAAPGTARVSGSRTVPRRPVNVPNTPSNVSASRNSDTSHRITWSQSTSSARPVTGFRIQRRTFGTSGWGGWVTRTSNVSSGSRAWTDTGTRNNRVYQWRVVAVNNAGTRTSSSTGSVWTTPYVPTNVSVRRISGDRIRLDWRDAVTYGSSEFQIRHRSPAGTGSWSDIATHSGGSYDSSQYWIHDNPSLSDTHEYAIRSRTTAMSPTLSSSWVYSDVIQLAAPPNAATVTGPTTVVDAQSNSVRVTWRHNPIDGSEQDSYQLRWRYDGGDGEWNTLSRQYSSTEAHTFPAGALDNNATVEVEVRTWGAHGDPGPYSSTFNFQTSDPPTAAINYPDPAEPEHHTSHVTAEWGFSDPFEAGQSHWEAELIRPVPGDPEALGTVIERRTGTGDASSVRFNRRLPDQTEWRVRVRVRSGNGLWSIWDQVDFTVSYPLPAKPEGGGAWDSDQGAVTVDVDEGVAEEGQEPTALVQLYRPGQAFFEGPAQEISTARAAAEEYGLPEGFYAENLVTNPRGRMTDGVVTMRRNLVTNPRGRDTDGVVTIRENLIGNPSFETSLTGLLSGPGTNPPQRVQAPSAVGEFVAEFEVDGAASNTGWVMQELELPSGTEGQYLAFSTMVRRDAGSTEAVRLRAWGRDADAESLPIQTLTGYIPLTSNFERLTGVFQIQPGAAMYRLYLWSYGSAGGAPADGTLQTDAWMVSIADTEDEAIDLVSDYFDGDTWDGDPDFSPQWEGVPHESSSRLVAPAPVGWTALGGGVVYYSASRDMIALRDAGGAGAVAVTGDVPPEGSATAVAMVEGTPGDEVVVFAGFSPTAGDIVTLTDTVQEVRATGNSAGWQSGFALVGNPEVGATVYFRVLATEGEYDGPWFDGDAWDGDPDISPQWEGEPHESPSRLVAPVPVGWEGSGLYYSEVNDAVAIPASPERQALLDAIAAYTDAPVQWSATEPSNTSVVWVDPETGKAREWTPEWERLENLAYNPRMFTDLFGWTPGISTEIERVSDDRGGWALRMANTTNRPIVFMYPEEPVTDLEPVTISWDARTTTATQAVVAVNDTENYNLPTARAELPIEPNGEWQRLTTTLMPDGKWDRYTFEFSGTGNSGEITNVMIGEGPYGDGDSPGWVWDGEPHASTSHRPARAAGWWPIEDHDVVAAGQAYAASFVRPPHESVQGTLAVQDVLADSTSYRPVDGQAHILPSDQHRYVRVAVVEGDYDGAVFDGHSEQEGVIFEWTGDEDESVSTAYLEWESLLDEYFEQHAVPIGPPVEPGTSITDYIPPLNEVVPYRVEALTELGASQASDIFLIETSPTNGWIHLNAGPNFSEHIRLKYNPGFSRAPERAKATHHFAGREEEVEIAGESRTTTGTITTSVLTLEGIYTEKEAQATPREIEAFADFPAPVCKRVPEVVAGREFVSLGAPSIDHGTIEASISLPWRKVHYDE